LPANFAYTTGESHSGSLRWSVRVSPTASIFVYYGIPTSSTGTGGSGDNLLAAPDSDRRVDTSQIGGTFYDTWTHAVALAGASTPVIRASLVVDSYWAGDQVLTLNSAEVNGNADANPMAPTTSHTIVGGTPVVTTGTPVQSNINPAYLYLSRVDGVGNGPISEDAITSAQGDTTKQYRQVDGMYIYNLDLKALNLGVGTYRVFITVNGPASGPDNGYADFDLV
jgi:hypothetical protein